jgi:2-succinyl-6-hydroxy-2,4-cyclohexadiene-1-carboxylate synthase
VVAVNGDALYFERRGRGQALMLLHGFTGSGRSLGAVARSLAHEFATLAPDLPGHGRSVGGAVPRDYAFERCLDRLVTTLERAGHSRAHWLGYSMGARLALGCAVRHPGRVASLVLVGGRAGIADDGERTARRDADEALARRIETVGVEAFVDEWLSQPIFATQRRFGSAFVEAERLERLANVASELAAGLRGLGPGAQPPLFDLLRHVEVPVLLVVGALDRPFVEHAREIARRLPAAEICEIEDAGHAAHLEQPAAFLAAAQDFLRRAARRAPYKLAIPVQETAS